MLELNEIHEGDCLELMARIPDGSVDMILCDLPYGTTQNKWDSIIDLPSLWAHYKRVVKPNGAIVLTAQTPFDKVLGVSNLAWLKYEWIWQKEQGSGHLNAKRAPMKDHENILIFCEGQTQYNPQFSAGKEYTIRSGRGSSNYGKQNETVTVNEGLRYPKTVQFFKRDKDRDHPTQKPVPLFEYLIKTYTNEGDVVLDNCAGSGTTAIAALNTGRSFICIEKDPVYYAAAKTRIDSHRMFL